VLPEPLPEMLQRGRKAIETIAIRSLDRICRPYTVLAAMVGENS
jgi:hypothetical protein